MPIRNEVGGQKVDEWDEGTGLYTHYDHGLPSVQRKMTAEELACVTAKEQAQADAQALEQAHQQVDSMHTDVPAWKQQIAADIAAVQASGWDALTADQRSRIVLRILNGFTSVIDAVVNHATVTGAIPP